MVAEKPSLAASLAQILSSGKNTSRRGMNGACSVHEWVGPLFGDLVFFKMTSVCGHIMGLDFTSKYNNWDKVDPLELFSCPTEKREATPKLKLPAFLAQEAKDCEFLVLWLDCDKEGENICFEVMEAVRHQININSPKTVWRARFSAITDKDIKAAMWNLVKPNIFEARSVDARQELDLRIGCAFTRYQTKFFQGKYGDLDASLISYGPCQTPTLGFCVARHDKIRTFKPEPYWLLDLILNLNGTPVPVNWARGNLFDKNSCLLFLKAVEKEKHVEVMDVTSSTQSKPKPQALNTVELMRVASSGLGMGPHHAMQIAERLYTQGYVSYPRTETTQYPDNFDLVSVLRQHESSPEWGDHVRDLLSSGMNKPRKGKDVGDHPPITPTKLATRNQLEGDAWRLYDYIVRHFIGTLSSDLVYSKKVAKFSAADEVFTLEAKYLLSPGYTSVMSWSAMKNEAIPEFRVGDEIPIQSVKMVERKTTPPDYLTESELISLMEKHGIGTDASIPVHINNICQRNYVTVTSGRRLVPTSLGIVLVHGYQKIDRELVEATMRSAIEAKLNLIARNEADFNTVLRETLDVFSAKFVNFTTNIEAMDQLFEVSFSPLAATGKAMSRCGKCRRYMKYIQAKPSRLHCSNCDETYSVPQNGNIRIYKELKCPIDDFELLCWSMGSKGKSFILCPYCYNNPPYRDMKKGSGCNVCSHPTCGQALLGTGIASCLQCERGVLVLDLSSAPKWKICCNKCDIIIHVFPDAQKVQVCTESNCDCGAQLIKVEYKEERTKLPRDLTELTACIFCNEDFAPLVEKIRAVPSRPARGGHHRSRGGGRGGKGKPRGGGGGKPKPPKDKMAQLAAYFV